MGRIQLGVIGRAHGVRGLVKVVSHTADPADLTRYGPLSDATGRLYTLRWSGEGIAQVARIIDGREVKVADRADAEALTNTKLFVDRSALPPPDDGEYYLADLIGLSVVDVADKPIGTVAVVHDYGAGASLEITRDSGGPLLLPFTAACVPIVDIGGRRLVVVPPDEVVVPSAAGSASPAGADAAVDPAASGPSASMDSGPDGSASPRRLDAARIQGEAA